MREMSVAEQRYLAVLAVIADGLTVKDAAAKQGVSRQTMHAWLAALARLPRLRGWPGNPIRCSPACRLGFGVTHPS